jgi:Serine acetyltransferase
MRRSTSLFQDLAEDLRFGVSEDGGSLLGRALTNRGFHALAIYRVSHRLRRTPLSPLGLLLTRLCQILYAIDIDPRARIAGGVIIYHGVGLVIGAGVVIKPRVVLFHGVTLGIKRAGRRDGFPRIQSHVVIGSGAKLFGPLVVGEHAVIGANCVISHDVPPHTLVKPAAVEFVSLLPKMMRPEPQTLLS